MEYAAMKDKLRTRFIVTVSITVMMFIVAMVLILFGCGTAPSICTGSQQWTDADGVRHTIEDAQYTALCRIDPYWAETKVGLFAVNASALSTGKYKPDAVYKVIDAIRDFYHTTPGCTMGQLAIFAATKLRNSPELFIISKTLQHWQTFTAIKVDNFTWYHLNQHLTDHELLAAMYE